MSVKNKLIQTGGVGIVIGGLLKQLENSVKSVIKQTEYSFNSVVNNVATNLLHTIYQVEGAYYDKLKATSQEVDETTRKVLLRLEDLVREFESKVIQGLVTDLESLTDRIGMHIASMPGFKNHSYIHSINCPLIVLDEQQNIGQTTIRLKGKSLNHEKNMVTIADSHLDFTSPTDNEMNISIPHSLFDNVTNQKEEDKYLRAEVKLHYKEGFLRKKTKSKTYTIEIRAISNFLGKLKVVFVTEKDDYKPKFRTESKESQKRHGITGSRVGKDGKDIVPSSSDYEIDINSIEHSAWGEKYCKNGSVKSSVEPKLPTKIRLNFEAKVNSKSWCVCRFGATVTFTERLKIPCKAKERKEKEIILHYNKRVIELPNDSKFIKYIELELRNKKIIRVSKEVKHSFMGFKFDIDTKLLSVLIEA